MSPNFEIKKEAAAKAKKEKTIKFTDKMNFNLMAHVYQTFTQIVF
jgi:hypothetical protein